jgi:hypothetical protein
MKKQEAIELVNNHLQEQPLNMENTNIAKINDAKDVWWFTIPPERFSNDLPYLTIFLNLFYLHQFCLH